jgi:hypothetical protein
MTDVTWLNALVNCDRTRYYKWRVENDIMIVASSYSKPVPVPTLRPGNSDHRYGQQDIAERLNAASHVAEDCLYLNATEHNRWYRLSCRHTEFCDHNINVD